jgi:hypothetical protein
MNCQLQYIKVLFINSFLLITSASLSISSQVSDSICSRSDVLFCTGFEESNWRGQWDDYDGNPAGSNDLMSDPGPFNISGNHVMRLRSPAGARGGADLVKVLTASYNRLYLRWYQKWETGYNFSAGCHNGGLHAGDRNFLGASDNRPTGSDWFSAWLEPCGENRMHFYAYYRGMYMDCVNPTGSCWGDHIPCMLSSNYCSNPKDNAPPLPLPPAPIANKWYCFEIMADAGTPTTDTSAIHPDGILNFWVDGVEYGPFEKLWLRTSANIKLGIVWLSLFNHDGTHSAEGIMVDDVVVSTQPIGVRGAAGIQKNAKYNRQQFLINAKEDTKNISLYSIAGKQVDSRTIKGIKIGKRLIGNRMLMGYIRHK